MPPLSPALFNADVGEGAGHDRQLIPLIGRANISCGAHAGSKSDQQKAIQLCLEHGVQVGAHPGYPDPENFGRSSLNLSLPELEDTLLSQLEYLSGLCQEEGAALTHIKPHGALYNQMASDAHFAKTGLEILKSWSTLPVMLLAQSEAVSVANQIGIDSLSEGFLDRRYTGTGHLVPRSEPNALITDPAEAREQAEALASGALFTASDGMPLLLKVDTICVHGDTPHALRFLQEIL